MFKHIFSYDAPQFFGCPEWFTEEEVREMREDFKRQKITVDDIKKAMGDHPDEYLDFEYSPKSCFSAQWNVRDYSEKDDYVILDFVGTAG
jgi:hypothetical protein